MIVLISDGHRQCNTYHKKKPPVTSFKQQADCPQISMKQWYIVSQEDCNM